MSDSESNYPDNDSQLSQDDQNSQNSEINEKDQDQALNELAKMSIKKKGYSKKEKDRKITDFKFRVMDLLELFITKSKNSVLFIHSLIPLIQTIQENVNDNKKNNYVSKLCYLIQKFLNQSQDLKIEFQDDIDQCVINSIFIAARIKSQNLFNLFSKIIFMLISIRLKINNDSKSQSFIVERMEDALKKLAQKKDIMYPSKFFKDFAKQFPELALKLMNSLIKYCKFKEDDGSRHNSIQQQMIEILHITIICKGAKSFIGAELNSNLSSIQEMILSLHQKNQDIKHKKYAFLVRLANLITDVINILNESQEINLTKKTKFLKAIQESINSFDDSDKNLTNIKIRILKLKINQ